MFPMRKEEKSFIDHMNKHTCARHCTRPSRGQVTQRAPLPPVLPASVCTAPDWPTGVWLGSEGLPSHPGLQGSKFPVCLVVILALGGLKEVEMCCEGPEAVPPGHLLCWLLGPRRLPLRCPGWLRVSAPSLRRAGGHGERSQAGPGLLGSAPVWTCSCSLVSMLPMGMV